MFFPEGNVRVFLYGEPVDMRKSFDGLYALARNGLAQDPLSGHLFAFVNRRAKQVVSELPVPPEQPDASRPAPAHKRRKPRSDFADDGVGASFFDEAKVPVQTIGVPNPEARGLSPEHHEVIGEKVSHRLAQRHDSFVVLKFTVDETPIKAGQARGGKMKATCFWPVHGEHDEVCFPHFESRRHEHVEHALGLHRAPGTVLLSDGDEAYASYARKTGIKDAPCWPIRDKRSSRPRAPSRKTRPRRCARSACSTTSRKQSARTSSLARPSDCID